MKHSAKLTIHSGHLRGYLHHAHKTMIPVLSCLMLFASFFATANTEDELNALLADGQYQIVVNALSKKDKKTVEQYNLLISALMNTDLDDAEDVADEFIETFADDYRSYHTHALVMGAQAADSVFSALGYAKKAKASLEKAVVIAPEKYQTHQALMMFHITAPGLVGGDMKEAFKLSQAISELNAIEGIFATVNYHRAKGELETAIELLSQLENHQQQASRALFQQGNLYLEMENFDAAIDTFEQLQSVEVTSLVESDQQENAAEQYEQARISQLYGLYRIGWIAVETKTHIDKGINALTAYLVALDETDVGVSELPSKNWTLLRLADLLLQSQQAESAKNALAKITVEDDERFTRLYKKLTKAVQKAS